LRIIAPDYPSFGQSDTPPPSQYAYTFDHIAQTMEQFVESLGRPDQDISRVFFSLLESHRSHLSSETLLRDCI
jgi:pimeloyl-ACP methyl ester carboxylesterase